MVIWIVDSSKVWIHHKFSFQSEMELEFDQGQRATVIPAIRFDVPFSHLLFSYFPTYFVTSLIASCLRILNWLYLPNCLRSIFTLKGYRSTYQRYPSWSSDHSPCHHKSGGRNLSCHKTRSRSWGYTSGCPRASCCRWYPRTISSESFHEPVEESNDK